ncbi:MAG TPA: DUF192 domain-containing protein [Gaiellaceae bacterium]|nr:DUF192 domain-containing protein [Gaiellaceae bacterium]
MREVVLRTPSGETAPCLVAERISERLVGLIGRAEAPRGGLLIRPCRSVHTAFMRFPCDVVFLARDGRVLRVSANTRPWRIRFAPLRTRCVLELASGEASRLGLEQGATVTTDDDDDDLF